jgi:hypothetical protein
MRKRWIASITTLFRNVARDVATRPATKIGALTVFYAAVIAALVLLYGRGDFSTPSFIYQDF